MLIRGKFMKNYETSDILNVALIGHTGKGKSTLAETMLFNAKATSRLGKVSEGTSVMDFDEQEIQRKISISASLASFEWKGKKINLIDVPGFPDFEAEKIQALRAVDSVIVVGSCDGEIAVGTEKAIKYCVDNTIPIFIFLNQTDKENANYIGTFNSIKRRYPRRTAPLEIPIMVGHKMTGYVDVLEGKSYEFTLDESKLIDMPDSVKDEYAGIRQSVIETSAENDEALLEKFFESGTLSDDEIVLGLQKGILSVSAMPVFAGSALYNKGVFNLMNAMVKMLPSAEKIQKVDAFDKDGNKVNIDFDKNGKFMAQVFKTIADPFVGKLNLFKVYNGTIKAGMTVLNSSKDKKERINQVMIPFGKKQENVDSLIAGDIGALSKLSYTDTGDTLCDESIFVKFEDIVIPEPVISMAVESKVHDDEEKVFQGLAKLQEEDNSFKITKQVETGQTLINGMGETQLDVILNKLKSKYKVDAVLSTPLVPYRETIKKKSEAEGTHKKQSGGGGQYGKVVIRFEPYFDGDFAFESQVVGGAVPKEYIPAVEKGLRDCIKKGVLAGYPVVGLKAVLLDGKYHPVDSNEISFKMAASISYKAGLKEASPVLLEPIYNVDVTVPENYTGDIMGDFNRRRGKIIGMDAIKDSQVVHAEAPLSELFKYSTDLRSMTQGRGSFTMNFVRYEEVPNNIAEKVVKERNQAE